MPKYRKVKQIRHFTPKYVQSSQPRPVWHQQMETSEQSEDSQVMYDNRGRKYVEESSDDDNGQWAQPVYPPKYQAPRSYAKLETESSDIELNAYSPLNMTPKRTMKPFRISKGRPPRNRGSFKPLPTYESSSDQGYPPHYQNRYEGESSDQNDENSRIYSKKPRLPPKSHNFDMTSNLSLPIVRKARIEEFEHDIESIISSNSQNKKKKISNIILTLNKCLLLSIDSYISFISEGDFEEGTTNLSYDSQLSQQLADHRISNFQHLANSWRETLPEIVLNHSSLIKLLKLVKTYCSNNYLRFIISSNVVVAFNLINEEDRGLRLMTSLDQISFKSSDTKLQTLYNPMGDMHSRKSGMSGVSSQSQQYVNILKGVKHFNNGVLTLRKMKTDAILNQRYAKPDTDDFEMREV